MSWIVDSGESQHVTTNSHTLDNSDDYTRTEKITMGNDNKIHVTHAGNIQLDSVKKITFQKHFVAPILKVILYLCS